jgi:hypothetical protein
MRMVVKGDALNSAVVNDLEHLEDVVTARADVQANNGAAYVQLKASDSATVTSLGNSVTQAVNRLSTAVGLNRPLTVDTEIELVPPTG